MVNNCFLELNEQESFNTNGGSVAAVCAWLILTYAASPLIVYVGGQLWNEAKRGYADGKAAR